jgi:LemA protein
MLVTLLIVGLLGVFALLFIIGIYNGLVGGRNEYQNSFAQIDVQLKRRHDLIPNLVEVSKKYMEHERETLEAVIQARNQAVTMQKRVDQNMSGENVTGLLAAETMLTGAVGKLFALSENYPDLKADSTMKNLMEELTSTENKISFARQRYNDVVMGYNVKREVFPNNIVAGMFNFQRVDQWTVDNIQEREVPKVQF